VLPSACDQQIENRARVRAAVDIVTKKNLHWFRDRIGPEIRVDASEKRAQEIRPTVYITDGIDACTSGYSRHRLLDRQFQNIVRQEVLQPPTVSSILSGPR
jgi:hypothetical protein